jgi:hypothetical protein
MQPPRFFAAGQTHLIASALFFDDQFNIEKGKWRKTAGIPLAKTKRI